MEQLQNGCCQPTCLPYIKSHHPSVMDLCNCNSYCGSGQYLQNADFSYRVYSAPAFNKSRSPHCRCCCAGSDKSCRSDFRTVVPCSKLNLCNYVTEVQSEMVCTCFTQNSVSNHHFGESDLNSCYVKNSDTSSVPMNLYDVRAPVQFVDSRVPAQYQIHSEPQKNGKKGVDTIENGISNDIRDWQNKHLENLKLQQIDVLGEKQGIVTSKIFIDLDLDHAPVQENERSVSSDVSVDTSNDSGFENSVLNVSVERNRDLNLTRVQDLELELKRQQLKVKLYEKMLSKSRQEIEKLRTDMKNQAVEYENKLHKLQQLLDERDTELLRKHDASSLEKELLSDNDCLTNEPNSEIESRSGEVPSRYLLNGESTQKHQSCYISHPVCTDSSRFVNRSTLVETRDDQTTICADSSRIANPTTVSLSTQTDQSSFASMSEHLPNSNILGSCSSEQVECLKNQIKAESVAVTSLEDDLIHKDRHLKKLRLTLKELSSYHHELLEKNIALEDKLRSRSKLTSNKNAIEYHLSKELDICVFELQAVVQVCWALANGTKADPIGFFHGQSSTKSVYGTEMLLKNRMDDVVSLRQSIGALREFLVDKCFLNRKPSDCYAHTH